MLSVTISFIPIFIAGIVSVFIGWIWYHQSVFGSLKMRGSGMTPEVIEQGKKRKPAMAFFALLASMLIAYVMSYFAIAWGVYDWIGAIELGFWCWAGFVAPTMLGSILWDKKPFSVYLINTLYWLVAFIAIALVLIFISPLITPQPYGQGTNGQVVQFAD